MQKEVVVVVVELPCIIVNANQRTENGVENEAIKDTNYFCGTVMITDIIMATLNDFSQIKTIW